MEEQEYTEKAKSQGWVPKEEFKGDETKWVDAKSFVERGENILPILRERNEKLLGDVSELKNSFKELQEFYKNSEERQYQKALQDLKRKQMEAVETADVDGYKSAHDEIAELEKTRVKKEVPKEPPEMNDFRKRNAWYDADMEMTDTADALGAAFVKKGVPYGKMLELVEQKMKQIYPEKFPKPKENFQAFEGAGESMGLPRKSMAKTYETLPPEAKKQCDKFVAQGILTKEDYVRDYAWD